MHRKKLSAEMFAEEFWKNALWKKKMERELKSRDLDGDGFVSKVDYDLLIQRYRELGTPEKHLEPTPAWVGGDEVHGDRKWCH